MTKTQQNLIEQLIESLEECLDDIVVRSACEDDDEYTESVCFLNKHRDVLNTAKALLLNNKSRYDWSKVPPNCNHVVTFFNGHIRAFIKKPIPDFVHKDWLMADDDPMLHTDEFPPLVGSYYLNKCYDWHQSLESRGGLE